MRLFEIMFIVSSLSFLTIKKFSNTTKLNTFLKVLIVSTLFIHILLEGVRYELVLFLIGFVLVIIPIPNYRKLRIIVSITLSVISFSLFVLFPVYTIQVPSGTYDVGTKTYQVEDITREEIYGDATGYRQFNFQVWYPFTKSSDHTRAPWLLDQEVTSQALSRDFGFPGFLLNQTKFVQANSYLNAPMDTTNQTYPIVIISHGWSGTKYLHTDLAETLASHGYIAVSIEHTYGSVATVFDDQVIYKQEDALTGFDDPISGQKSNTRLMMTYGLDVISTIDYLENLNDDATDIFYNKLDLTSIGVIGHSTGGGGAIYAALHDERIDALIGLDAWVEPIASFLDEKNLSIPSLFLRSETWETGPNNTVLLPMLENTLDVTSLYQIQGTTHYDFAMVYMYTSLSKLIGFSGSIQTHDMLDILFESSLSFYDHYLLGEDLDDAWIQNPLVENFYTNEK